MIPGPRFLPRPLILLFPLFLLLNQLFLLFSRYARMRDVKCIAPVIAGLREGLRFLVVEGFVTEELGGGTKF